MSTWILVAALVLLGAGVVATADRPLGIRQIASNGTYGCRRPFGAGVYVDATDTSAVCWNGEGMSVYARQFNHRSGTWGPTRRIWKNNWTTKWDYHNYPTMVLAPDGHLLIFFFQHSQQAYMLRSPRPGSIEGTWKRTALPVSRPAYPMPIVYDKTIYLFYSRSDNIGQAYRTYRYIKSTDNGQSWSKVRMAIDSQQKVPGRFDEVYALDYHVEPARQGRAGRIHLTWEMHGGPGHNIGSRNNYLVYFLPGPDTFQAVDGTDLGAWVDFQEMDSKCVVQEGGARRGHPLGYSIKSVALPDGSAVAVYRNGSRRHLVVWDGKAWKQRPAPPAVDDITVDANGVLRVLGKSRAGLSIHESRDRGTSWRRIWSGSFPHANGSTAICNAAFLAGWHAELPVMACGVDRPNRMKDYSGKWPVVVVQRKDE
jgi:hypothetical protein